MLKFAFNLIDDGLVGQQLFAGEATRLAYGTPRRPRAATRSWRSDPGLVPVPLALLTRTSASWAVRDGGEVKSCGGRRRSGG